jgi:RNA polymerase sigma-70 factor (ECF subfamily)
MEDAERVERYLQGDVEALAALVERHRRPLMGFIYNMVGDPVEADEVFQEMWFRAIRKLREYREGNFGGWLARIARNLAIDRVRRRKPNVSLDAEPETGSCLRETLASPLPDPGQRAEAADFGARIGCAVAALPVELREVFLLRTKAQLPFKEIATIQAVSINTALARMQYALNRLRKALADDYESLARA